MGGQGDRRGIGGDGGGEYCQLAGSSKQTVLGDVQGGGWQPFCCSSWDTHLHEGEVSAEKTGKRL